MNKSTYDDGRLTDKQKASILDKLIAHAEAVEDGRWQKVGGLFVDKTTQNAVKRNAIAFLIVARAEVKECLQGEKK